jgi:hypothetical protein
VTKAELISALEWFKDDAELHIVVPHEALEGLEEVLKLDSARYQLIPPQVQLVARRPLERQE